VWRRHATKASQVTSLPALAPVLARRIGRVEIVRPRIAPAMIDRAEADPTVVTADQQAARAQMARVVDVASPAESRGVAAARGAAHNRTTTLGVAPSRSIQNGFASCRSQWLLLFVLVVAGSWQRGCSTQVAIHRSL
jgi:hypothetical protein